MIESKAETNYELLWEENLVWPFQDAALAATEDILDPNWNTRHGAAMLLLSILEGNADDAGRVLWMKKQGIVLNATTPVPDGYRSW